MKFLVTTTVLIGVLAGCTQGASGVQGETRRAGISTDILRPQSRPVGLQTAPPPSQTARSVAQFDTTTPAERAAAGAAPASGRGGSELGATIASLGTPTEPGFWLKTPLVSTVQQGRVRHPATGKSVHVTLIPIEGASTAGSRMSLAALRLIGAPLAELSEVTVFAAPE